jgi:acetyl-CoA carboxylase biotin carboxyl carrier protein
MSAAPLAVQPTPTVPAALSEAEQAAAAGHVVKSPMVGTFYASSSPEAKPFVQVGTVVKEGETICIIEAMKILNEIEADKSGTITRILVDNGQAVEYGQPLFHID